MENQVVVVPVDWLRRIEEKIDALSADQPVPEEPGTTMDTKEAAAYLQVDPNTIYRWAREDKIPHVRVGKKLFFYKGELDSWMKER